MRLKRLWALLPLVAALGACDDFGLRSGGQGELRWIIAGNGADTRAASAEIPDTNDFILKVIQDGGGELTLEKFIDDTLHTVACKAACKAGQPLSYEEMRKLLDEYAECPVADHCPHGRPSVLIWSCTELDKMFCRIL